MQHLAIIGADYLWDLLNTYVHTEAVRCECGKIKHSNVPLHLISKCYKSTVLQNSQGINKIL